MRKILGAVAALALTVSLAHPASAQENHFVNAQSSIPQIDAGSSFAPIDDIVGNAQKAIDDAASWAQKNIAIPFPGFAPAPSKPSRSQKPAPRNDPPRTTQPRPTQPRPSQPAFRYQNCTHVWNTLGRPIRSHERGFHSRLDRDGDGVGCERDPR